MQGQPNPHRTDLNRGKLVRVAPGICRRENDPDPTRFQIFWSVDGVECSGVFRGTLTQAKKERERKRVKSDAGELVAPSRIKFAEVWNEYEAMVASLVGSGEMSKRTLELYRQRYKTHIGKALGARRVQEIHAKHLSDLLSTLRGKALVVDGTRRADARGFDPQPRRHARLSGRQPDQSPEQDRAAKGEEQDEGSHPRRGRDRQVDLAHDPRLSGR
jgi:hypothetical protein